MTETRIYHMGSVEGINLAFPALAPNRAIVYGGPIPNGEIFGRNPTIDEALIKLGSSDIDLVLINEENYSVDNLYRYAEQCHGSQRRTVVYSNRSPEKRNERIKRLVDGRDRWSLSHWKINDEGSNDEVLGMFGGLVSHCLDIDESLLKFVAGRRFDDIF